jgi:hypothetical protein
MNSTQVEGELTRTPLFLTAMGTEEAPAQRETPDDDAHNESSSDSVHEATFSADDDDWKRKVLGALHARQLRLEDESKPPADAPCRTNRTGIIAQPMNLLRTPGKARNLKEFFEVWLHIVHGTTQHILAFQIHLALMPSRNRSSKVV